LLIYKKQILQATLTKIFL